MSGGAPWECLDRDAAALLAIVHAEQRAWSERVRPPATEDALAALAGTLRSEFGADLPEGWAAFLRASDGLDFNGFVLYATREGGGPLPTLGMAETNHGFQEAGPQGRFLLLGESGGTYFAHDLASGGCLAFDWVSLDEIARFPDAPTLLRHVLGEALRR